MPTYSHRKIVVWVDREDHAVTGFVDWRDDEDEPMSLDVLSFPPKTAPGPAFHELLALQPSQGVLFP